MLNWKNEQAQMSVRASETNETNFKQRKLFFEMKASF